MPNVQQFFKRLFNHKVDLEGDYMDQEQTINYRNIHDVEPPLYNSIRYNRLDELGAILEEGIAVNCVHSGTSTTPLHLACELGNLPALKLLMKHGGCVDALEKDGGPTLLLVSATVGSLDVVRYLLDCGADVNASGDQTPPHVAAHDGERRQSDYPEVLDAYYGNVPLIQACREGHVTVAHELLKRGCNINAQNRNGNTALHVACLGRTFFPYPTEQSIFIPSTFFRRPDPYLVTILLHYGASMDIVNYMSQTPLQRLFAIRHRYHLGMTGWSFSQRENNDIIRDLFAVIHCLLQHGANLPSYFSYHLRLQKDSCLSHELLTTVKFVENFGLMDDVFPVILDTMIFSLDNGCMFDPEEVKSLKCYDPQFTVLTEHLYPLVMSPRPLKSLCRQFLRCYMKSVCGSLSKETVNKLPLPESMTWYLMGEQLNVFKPFSTDCHT